MDWPGSGDHTERPTCGARTEQNRKVGDENEPRQTRCSAAWPRELKRVASSRIKCFFFVNDKLIHLCSDFTRHRPGPGAPPGSAPLPGPGFGGAVARPPRGVLQAQLASSVLCRKSQCRPFIYSSSRRQEKPAPRSPPAAACGPRATSAEGAGSGPGARCAERMRAEGR